MTTTAQEPIIIYAEGTPNPGSMKFVANKMLIAEGLVAEYTNAEQAKGSPLAAKLFEFPFVKNIFISFNFITITKSDAVQWEEINYELRIFIREYLAAGGIVLNELPEIRKGETVVSAIIQEVIPETEIEKKIVDILEEYIRPAVEQDGGLISFRSFKDGIVTVVLRGSCSGCPSATITLKSGIEALLKKMVPGVDQVVAEQL